MHVITILQNHEINCRLHRKSLKMSTLLLNVVKFLKQVGFLLLVYAVSFCLNNNNVIRV